MVAAPVLDPSPFREGAERRFLLHDVPWWTYVALRDALDETGVRMTFLEGELELMSPSDLHEESKKLLARLVETWADETGTDLRGFGSTTFRREAAERGLEPDECYTLGPKAKDGVPHVAIEVVVASPLLDKLAVYAGLGVSEVWTWRVDAKRVVVHRLVDGRYEEAERSGVVPALDLALLARFVRPGESHTALAKAYREALRAGSLPLVRRLQRDVLLALLVRVGELREPDDVTETARFEREEAPRLLLDDLPRDHDAARRAELIALREIRPLLAVLPEHLRDLALLRRAKLAVPLEHPEIVVRRHDHAGDLLARPEHDDVRRRKRARGAHVGDARERREGGEEGREDDDRRDATHGASVADRLHCRSTFQLPSCARAISASRVTIPRATSSRTCFSSFTRSCGLPP